MWASPILFSVRTHLWHHQRYLALLWRKQVNSQDQNAATSDPVVGAFTAPKKDVPHAAKVPVDKKKLDARKKSLKRL